MATLRAAPLTLLLILLGAGLHSAAAALIRPLFQASDEVTYLASLQRTALAVRHDASTGVCLSPPAGEVPPWMPAGGKWLFHEVGAKVLRAACAAGAGQFAPLWVRLAFSLSLPVVAWAAWQSVRLVREDAWGAAVAALAIASQPVMAKYAGAITPDSLANACSALAILVALRLLVRGPTVARVGALLAWTGLAATLKDATLFLVPLHGLVLAYVALRGQGVERRRWIHGATAVAGVAVIVLIGTIAGTTYDVGPGVRRALNAPLTFLALVANDTIGQVPGMLATAWTSLGVFGGTSAPLPAAIGGLVLVAAALAVSGLGRLAADPAQAPWSPATWYLLAAVGLCALQAPVRLVLLNTADLHQGRWLFPVAVPAALAFALGLERALGRRAPRSWPLLALGALMVTMLPLLAVAQWHVTTPAWTLDRSHLFLYSTGGLDIDPLRVESTLRHAWPAARGVVMPLAAGCGLCLALLMRMPPSRET